MQLLARGVEDREEGDKKPLLSFFTQLFLSLFHVNNPVHHDVFLTGDTVRSVSPIFILNHRIPFLSITAGFLFALALMPIDALGQQAYPTLNSGGKEFKAATVESQMENFQKVPLGMIVLLLSEFGRLTDYYW